MNTVSAKLLEELGAQLPPSPTHQFKKGTAQQFDLERWINDHGLLARETTLWNGNRRWIFDVCPWNPEHRKRSAYVIQFQNGALSAGCHHRGCRDKDWHALRDVVEPGWRTNMPRAEGLVAGASQVWELPIPFHQFHLPCFPTRSLPEWLRTFVEALATATQTPVDLAGMLVLSVLAACCAKKVIVRIKDGYCEPVNLFNIIALPSGSRKTTVFKAVTKPLEDQERSEARRTCREIAEAQAVRNIKEAKLKKLQEEAVNATEKQMEKLSRQIAELAGELATTPIATPTRYLADDCTPEKLGTLLRQQGGRIAVMSPEGDVFDLLAGRYSPNAMSNLGLFLKGHSGDSLRIDRVSRPTEYVEAPALTVGLAVQPDVIRGLAERPGFRGRGLLGRFCYGMPKSLLGSRDTNPPPVAADVSAVYHENILSLLSLPFDSVAGEPGAHVLNLDTGAQASVQRFTAWIEPQLAEFGDLGSIADWGGKLAGTVSRISGLLHLATHVGSDAPWEIPIAQQTVEDAISIGEYYIPHAKAAFAEMGADKVVEHAKKVLRWLHERGLDSFSKRDLHQALRGTFKRPADLDQPLDVLVTHGFIRVRETANVGPGRPSSPVYDVNPLGGSHNTHNPQNSKSDASFEDYADSEEAL